MPRYRRIDLLKKVRRRRLCLELLALIRELLSLQDFHWVMQFGGRQTNCREFFWFNANTGCGSPKVLDTDHVCMDWGKGRAHFTVPGKPKRCLRRTGADFDVGLCNNSSLRCSQQW
jgi:hypothetical protein